MEEAKAHDRYYGLETRTPRLVVAIHAKVGKILDLTSPSVRRQLGITLAELHREDWRKLLQSGHESLSQTLGRAVSATGATGLLVRSAAVPRAHNVVLFPPVRSSDHLTIIEGDTLARLTTKKKP